VIYWLRKVDNLTRRKVLHALRVEQSSNVRFVSALKTNMIVYASRRTGARTVKRAIERALTLAFKVPVRVEILSMSDLRKALDEVARTYKELSSR